MSVVRQEPVRLFTALAAGLAVLSASWPDAPGFVHILIPVSLAVLGELGVRANVTPWEPSDA